MGDKEEFGKDKACALMMHFISIVFAVHKFQEHCMFLFDKSRLGFGTVCRRLCVMMMRGKEYMQIMKLVRLQP